MRVNGSPRKEIAPYANRWSQEERFPVEVFRAMGDLGLMGLLVPERYGGSDAGMVAYVAAMEEIGAADQSVAAAWNAHITIASLPLLAFGSEEQGTLAATARRGSQHRCLRADRARCGIRRRQHPHARPPRR